MRLLTLYSSKASSQVRTSAESSQISASVNGFVAFLVFPMSARFLYYLRAFVAVEKASGRRSVCEGGAGGANSHRLASACSVGGKKKIKRKKLPSVATVSTG